MPEVLQLHDDPFWGLTNQRRPAGSLYGESPGTFPITSGAPQLQNDPPPASGPQQVHDDGTGEFDSSYRWHNDFRVIEGAPLSSLPQPPPPPHEAEADTDTFFNDALNHKLKIYAGAGAVAGVSAGLTLGIQKLIKEHSHGACVSAFFPPLLLTSNRVANILTYGLPQSTLWQGSCK
jgi:hypothetical protein